MRAAEPFVNGIGLGHLLTRSEYGFGNGAPGGLYRKQVFSYWNNTNRLADAQVQDTSSNRVAETRITYDSTSLTSVTGVTHHDDTNYGTSNTTRGNPTVIQRWTGSSNLSTTLTYDTTGQVTQVTDPNSNSTTLSYSHVFYTDNGSNPPASYSPGVTTNAYVTKLTLPTTGSVSHVTNFGYYYYSGKLATGTDENGSNSYLHFLDSLDRLTHVYVPAGGWTLRQYSSATQRDIYTGLTDTTASSACTGCRHDQVMLDALGRVSSNILASDSAGADHVDTTYDSSGRVSTVSSPYRSTSDATIFFSVVSSSRCPVFIARDLSGFAFPSVVIVQDELFRLQRANQLRL